MARGEAGLAEATAKPLRVVALSPRAGSVHLRVAPLLSLIYDFAPRGVSDFVSSSNR